MTKVVDVVVDSANLSTTKNLTEIGSRMKVAREVLGLTQDGLAKAVRGSKRGIQENETRNRVPGGEVIAGMVELGINANWLLTGEGPMLLEDIQQLAAPSSPKINVDALEAIIEGILVADPKATAAHIAGLAVSVYQRVSDQGLITLKGLGPGHLSNAA